MGSKERNGRQVDRRRDILAAAEKIFGEKGYSEASIDEIALEAGVAKGSIYNYFKSKHDLFMQLFCEEMEGFRVEIQQVIAKDFSAHEKLTKLIDLSFSRIIAEKDKEFCSLALEFCMGAIRQSQNGEISQVFGDLYNWYRDVIIEILQFGQQQGEFELEHETNISATLLMAVLDGLWLQSLLGVVENIGEDHLKTLRQVIFKTISKEIIPNK